MNKTLTAESLNLSRGFFQIPFVRSIEKEFGFKGSKLLLDILFEVTETGFETQYNLSLREKIAQRNNVSERLVDMVVHRMVKNDYLDQKRYSEHHVLAIPDSNIVNNEEETNNKLSYFFIKPCYDNITSEKTGVISEKTQVISKTINNTSSLLSNNL